MTTSQVRALARRAGALLGAVAVLAAGCATAGGGSGPRAGRADAAQDAVAASASIHAASASSHGLAHRAARPTWPGSARHSGGARIAARRTLLWCQPAVGHPVVSPVSVASGARLVVPVCRCCGWCSCGWACGSGTGRWPPRPHMVWQCCPRWHPQPGWGSSPIPPTCWPGCGALACPASLPPLVPGPARAPAGSSLDHAPGGTTAGAS
jgi:hypothetical protein